MRYGPVLSAAAKVATLLLGCVGGALTCAAQAAGSPSAGPLVHEFSVTLAPHTRTEAAGPLFYREVGEGFSQWALPPFFSRTERTDVDATEMDVLYPLLTYDRFGAEYRFQIIQLFSFSGGGSQQGDTAERFSLFPFYFQQRSADPSRNYTALLPFYGHLKGRLLRDEIRFVLFPLFSETRKKDVVTDNYVFPFFHLRHGNALTGWQFWPLVGHEHKGVTTRTNVADEVEILGGHDKFFAAWPFFFRNRLGLGTTNEQTQNVLLPLYSTLRSPARDSTTVLFPFFTRTEDREKRFTEWDVPYPLVVFARGEGKYTTRVWPFYSHATNAVLTSDFYLWPLYKYNRAQAEPLDRERTRWLLFLWSDLSEKNTATGAAFRRKDLWPLFTWRHELNGNERLQVLAPLEPLVPNNKSIERNWSPLWSLWRAEHNAQTGARSQSLLWNLYRHDEAGGAKKCSLLFGLIQYQSTPEGERWRWFHWPEKPDPRTPTAPAP